VSDRAPRAAGNAARGAPLLVTAELPPDVLAWADALRRAHYPPERNRLRAHVTLFHALPPSSEGEVRRLLGDFARRPPPAARVSGLFDLGRGTAWDLASPALVAMHAEIADSLHGILVGQEMRELRPHITIQNKVAPQAASALQAQLRTALPEVAFRFHGLGLYAWDDALWRPLHTWPFRGRD